VGAFPAIKVRLFLMVSGKFSPGNFSGTKWAREVSGGNLLHPDTFSDFPEPHPAVPCSGKFMPDFPEQLTTFGKFWDKKRWDVSSNSERLEAPELSPIQIRSVRFKSVRSGTKKNSLGKATFSSPSPLYSLYSRAYVVKQISRREFPGDHKKQPYQTFPP